MLPWLQCSWVPACCHSTSPGARVVTKSPWLSHTLSPVPSCPHGLRVSPHLAQDTESPEYQSPVPLGEAQSRSGPPKVGVSHTWIPPRDADPVGAGHICRGQALSLLGQAALAPALTACWEWELLETQ